MSEQSQTTKWELVELTHARTSREAYMDGDSTTKRLRVPGGWIYRMQWRSRNGLSESAVFVPEAPDE